MELWQDRKAAEDVRVSDSDLDEEVSDEEDDTAVESRSSSHTTAAAESTDHPQVLPSRRSIMWQARVGTAGLGSSVTSRESMGDRGPLPDGSLDTALRTIPSMSVASEVSEGAQAGPSLYRPSPLFRVSVSGSVMEEPEDSVVSVRSAGEFLLGSVWGSNTVRDGVFFWGGGILHLRACVHGIPSACTLVLKDGQPAQLRSHTHPGRPGQHQGMGAAAARLHMGVWHPLQDPSEPAGVSEGQDATRVAGAAALAARLAGGGGPQSERGAAGRHPGPPVAAQAQGAEL